MTIMHGNNAENDCLSTTTVLEVSSSSNAIKELSDVITQQSLVNMDINENPKLDNDPDCDDDDDSATLCGFGFFKGHPMLQKYATRKCYVIVFSALSCMHGAAMSYYSSTLSTVEKQFGIPSKITGFIAIGHDLSTLLITSIIMYYVSKKHQPRWIGFGAFTIAMYCFLSSLPYFIFGPGENALELTTEYASRVNINSTNESEINSLCGQESRCETQESQIWAPIIMFIANFILGLGGLLCFILGIAYMDDNTTKSQSPALLSLAFFTRSIGPVLGHFASSYFLNIYIAPNKRPIIKNNDPRWLGAWWIGFVIFGICIIVCGAVISLFPKELSETKQMRKSAKKQPNKIDDAKPSLRDMVQTYMRLLRNKVYLYNSIATIFYMLGAIPFMFFAPKYVEVAFAQTASRANLVTGSIGFISGALGLLISAMFLSKYKPTARNMSSWNVITAVFMLIGVLYTSVIKCPQLSSSAIADSTNIANTECNSNCNCEYAKYSPVCSVDGKHNYISPCHAGCSNFLNKEIYYNCSCVKDSPENTWENDFKQAIKTGLCPVDCESSFRILIIVIFVVQFINATGRVTNQLVSLRCVNEKDKVLSMGIGVLIVVLFGLLPAPIYFGHLIDKTCIVWGKTCTGKSNCWVYNTDKLRIGMNYNSGFFIFLGIIFDMVVWYYAKDVMIFEKNTDDEKGDEVTQNEIILN